MTIKPTELAPSQEVVPLPPLQGTPPTPQSIREDLEMFGVAWARLSYDRSTDTLRYDRIDPREVYVQEVKAS